METHMRRMAAFLQLAGLWEWLEARILLKSHLNELSQWQVDGWVLLE